MLFCPLLLYNVKRRMWILWSSLTFAVLLRPSAPRRKESHFRLYFGGQPIRPSSSGCRDCATQQSEEKLNCERFLHLNLSFSFNVYLFCIRKRRPDKFQELTLLPPLSHRSILFDAILLGPSIWRWEWPLSLWFLGQSFSSAMLAFV